MLISAMGLIGASEEILRTGQSTSLSLPAPSAAATRGAKQSEFGSLPRVLIRGGGDGDGGGGGGGGGRAQVVLRFKGGSASPAVAAGHKPFLYLFRPGPDEKPPAAGKFVPGLRWWDNAAMVGKQRVDPQHGVARIDLTDPALQLAPGAVLVAVVGADPGSGTSTAATPVEAVLTVHSARPVEVTPVLWVPEDGGPVDICLAHGTLSPTATVDITQPAWHRNPSARLEVTADSARIVVALSMLANTGAGVRVDLARADEGTSPTALGEAGHTIIDETNAKAPAGGPAYNALPELARTFTLSRGTYFVVPSAVAEGAAGKFRLEVWGARGSFKCTAPSENALETVAHLEHDPAAVPRALGTAGYEEVLV
jgi:hypothetical protein